MNGRKVDRSEKLGFLAEGFHHALEGELKEWKMTMGGGGGNEGFCCLGEGELKGGNLSEGKRGGGVEVGKVVRGAK